MPLFTSSREKHLWIWAFSVFAAIFSTLFIGQPLARLLANQNIQWGRINFDKLNSMDFNENERLKFSLKKTKGLIKEV